MSKIKTQIQESCNSQLNNKNKQSQNNKNTEKKPLEQTTKILTQTSIWIWPSLIKVIHTKISFIFAQHQQRSLMCSVVSRILYSSHMKIIWFFIFQIAQMYIYQIRLKKWPLFLSSIPNPSNCWVWVTVN